jgi:hypothetical protein
LVKMGGTPFWNPSPLNSPDEVVSAYRVAGGTRGSKPRDLDVVRVRTEEQICVQRSVYLTVAHAEMFLGSDTVEAATRANKEIVGSVDIGSGRNSSSDSMSGTSSNGSFIRAIAAVKDDKYWQPENRFEDGKEVFLDCGSGLGQIVAGASAKGMKFKLCVGVENNSITSWVSKKNMANITCMEAKAKMVLVRGDMLAMKSLFPASIVWMFCGDADAVMGIVRSANRSTSVKTIMLTLVKHDAGVEWLKDAGALIRGDERAGTINIADKQVKTTPVYIARGGSSHTCIIIPYTAQVRARITWAEMEAQRQEGAKKWEFETLGQAIDDSFTETEEPLDDFEGDTVSLNTRHGTKRFKLS